MSKEIATATASTDATSLADSVFGADEAPEVDANGEVKKPVVTEDTSEESTDEKETDSATGEAEEEAESTEEETSEEESTDEDEKPEAKPKSWKVGNQEFASPEALAREANRVVGRNGQLAGELRTKESQIATLSSERDEAAAKVKEWEEWAASLDGGEQKPSPANKPLDPDDLAERVYQKGEARRLQAERESSLRKEVDTLQSLPNYGEVADVVFDIADAINPITKRVFTPKEAYAYACREVGVENLWDKQQVKPAAVPPKKIDRSTVKSAAARPAVGRNGTEAPKAKHEPTFAEEMLSQSMM